MNEPIGIAIVWILVAAFAVLSIVLLSGKGSFLIAGYNTSSQKEKSNFNEKRLCRVVGGGLGIVTIIIGINAFYKFTVPPALSWLMPWGLLATVTAILVLANTICKTK